MSSATFAGNSDASTASGFCPAPPPPPPPPALGPVPVMRINTVETPVSRRSMPSVNDPYEPPAAIQNAMMTKDKKPFTYTPGMGGKLDLSQIRSPRMARRVAKNANDEGIEGPPKSPLAAEQAPRPVSTGANLFIQPQVAVPVFPTNAPQVTRPQVNRTQSNAVERNPETPRPTVKIESRPSSQPHTPDTPTSPTLVNLNKAPTPWMQKNVREKQQEELPEWARRSNGNGNGSASYSPPQSPPGVITYVQPQSPVPQQQQQRVVTQMRPVQQPGERVIPLDIEDRPSVFTIKNDPGASGHHQLKQTPPHHQSRWYAPQNSQNQTPAPRPISSPPVSQPQSGGTYIVPMAVEGSNRSPSVNSQYQQPAWNEYSQPTPSQVRGNFQQRATAPIQAEPGPVQSRSFRVLQKITSTDNDDADTEQLRKLQLTEDDKLFMNKVKEQVDGDVYLHQEEDPRYRGAAIPSRAFRYLQNMTDSGDGGVNTNAAPARNVNSALKKQNRNSRTFEETQSNVPASEQQVQEPKKYTGSAIPSRSFRILQAMTTPESVANQDNRQADNTCQTSNSMMPQGKHQGVIPRYSQTINWTYPIPCTINQPNCHYHYRNECNNSIWNQYISPTHACNCVDDKYASTIADNDISYSYFSIYDKYFCSPMCYNISQLRRMDRHCNNCLEVPQSLDMLGSQVETNEIDEETSDCDWWSKIRASEKISNDLTTNIRDECDEKVEKIEELIDMDNSTNYRNPESSETSSSADNCPIDDETDSESSSSDGDSESYLAYSTGVNSRTIVNTEEMGKLENFQRQNSTDCESSTDDGEGDEEESETARENENRDKQPRDDEIHKKDGSDEIKPKEDLNEAKNNPPNQDYESPMTVNVRLPLRFKVSVSTSEDQVRTVSFDKSTMQSGSKLQSQLNSNAKALAVETSTTVDFTLRRKSSIRPKSWCPDKWVDEFLTSETIRKKRNLSPVVFNARSVNEDDDVKDLEEDKQRKFDDQEIQKLPKFSMTVDEGHKHEQQLTDENNKNKYLLTVQNSRDETDEEDSGVTSDLSRLISEVDTDSESTPVRKASAYKRTQTHSRLFRLIRGDSILPEDGEDILEDNSGGNQLDLPQRQSTAFNYDHSNDSSGLTSPDFSPIFETSWRRFQETVGNGGIDSVGKDSYFKTWKEAKAQPDQNPQGDESSSAVNPRIPKNTPAWLYKSKVLCPRVRSTKNVPRTLQGRISKPVIHPGPWGIKHDRC